MAKNSNEEKSIIKLFHDNKSGLEGLDAEHVNRLINDVTRGTPFYNHKLKKEQKIEGRVKQMKEQLENCTFIERENAKRIIENLKSEYRELGKDLTHVIMHIDMDFYFAAIEIRNNPELADKPIAVGSLSMISTSNYNARKFGVRAGMPGFIGLKLCPQLQLIPGQFHLYKQESQKIMAILKEYDETFIPYSLDEASIDLTDYLVKKFSLPNSKINMKVQKNENGDLVLPAEVWNSVSEVVREIRTKIFEKTQLTCSAGIAPNKMIAKICSDINKPNNQYLLKGTSSKDLVDFVRKLNVKKIPGIGPVQQQTLLKGFGIETVQQLYDKLNTLMLVYTLTQMEYFVRISLGVSSFETNVDEPRKSESREETFSATNDETFLLKILKELCECLCSSLIRHGNIKGKTITLKIKKDTFEVNVRSKTINNYVNDAETIYEVGKKLLLNEMKTEPGIKLRLIGIRLSSFQDENKGKNQQTRIDKLFKLKSEESSSGKSVQAEASTSSKRNHLDIDAESNLNDLNSYGNSKSSLNELKHPSVPCNPHGTNEVNTDVINSFLCPVCSIRRFSALDQLNHHIDYCLSKDCIVSSVKEFDKSESLIIASTEQPDAKRKLRAVFGSDSDKASPKKKKAKEITEYFGKV